MASRLTVEEQYRLYELAAEGRTHKEISDTMCREFARDTLDRTTIQQWLRKRPANQTSKYLCARGAHIWVRETLSSLTSFSAKDSQRQPAGYFVNVGKRKTCRYCGEIAPPPPMVKGDGEVAIPSDFGIRVPPTFLQPVAEG